jgi:hypothetical protein
MSVNVIQKVEESVKRKEITTLAPAGLLGGVVIPENSVAAVRLIIEEAAAVLKGHAERMHEMAAPDDWKSKTAAMLTMDHVKKLAWVHGLLTPPNEKADLPPTEARQPRSGTEGAIGG